MPRHVCYRKADVYDNGLVIGLDGNPSCTLNGERLDWYLKRGLATEVTPPAGYPRAIQLNFKSKFTRSPQPYELAVIKNQCCLCGAKEQLTLHHVVPTVIRKRFPTKEKGRSRQWCLLLCVDCHKNVEDVTQAVYKNGYPPAVIPPVDRDRITLRRLKGMGVLDRIGTDKFNTLMATSGYTNIESIPGPPTREDEKELHRLYSTMHHKAIDQWAIKFIEDHGGIERTKAYFRDLFLTFNPKYLPEGYLDT